MLAQNFKTPADLKITSRQFDALAKVLGMLEREEIPAKLFNMGSLATPDPIHNCGTPGCIRGWARSIDGRAFPNVFSHKMPIELQKLFYLNGTEVNRLHALMPEQFERTTRNHAAVALRNFLTHGEPRWEEALSA